MALKLLNTEHNDFSDEFLVLLAAVGYCIYGAQLIVNKAARECDLHNLKDCFFQEKKKYVGNCADAFDKLVSNLNVFDSWFDKVQKGRADYLKYVHQNANDLVKLLLLYYSRTENHPERRELICDAIRGFEIDDAADYDSILAYFDKKF